MKRAIHTAATGAFLISIGVAQGEEESSRYRFIAQYAGEIGMVSGGIGTSPWKHWDLDLLLGYTPAWSAGRDIYALSAKFNYRFAPMVRREPFDLRLYAGFSVIYYPEDRYSNRRFPSDYYNYPMTPWHLMPHAGVQYMGKGSGWQRMSFYAEVGAFDTYLIHYYNNPGYVPLEEVFNFSLGFAWPLH